MRTLSNALTSPIGQIPARILKKANPELAARISDIPAKLHRRSMRKLGLVPLLEHARRPEILTKEFDEKKKQRALVASVRRNSVDG